MINLSRRSFLTGAAKVAAVSVTLPLTYEELLKPAQAFDTLTTQYCNLVKYVGNGGSVNTLQVHGLGTTPEFFIIKKLNAPAKMWEIYNETMQEIKHV